MDRKLGGPQSQSGRGGPCWELNPGRPTHSLVTILFELSWLLLLLYSFIHFVVSLFRIFLIHFPYYIGVLLFK